jgi:hypothetical protein
VDDETPESPPVLLPNGSTSKGGQPRKHSHTQLRRTLTLLTTRRLDGRSAVAIATKQFKADVTADLGGDLTRAQQTVLEDAAQSWIIRQALDDYISRQPSIVTKKRTILPVVLDRMRVAEHLSKQLDRLGLARKAKQLDLMAEITRLHAQDAATATQPEQDDAEPEP